ncbi:Lrp/AsnC family transcriptional regulator [Glutamicibacter soli]|uniref:Lrp/AsnC family transcriptional regulator n=1 Tax=Glutamicibacter soli TaxID=453836 RepID=UPI003FD0A8DC
MLQDYLVDALDLRIINALQIRPRAPWTQLAPILGADAATLNRRWQQLADHGLAWITTFDWNAWEAAALVEINCHSGANTQVALALAESPEAIAVDLTAGGRDIVATVAARDSHALGKYLLDELPKVPSVASVRSHPIARTLIDGRSWRVRALDAHESARIAGLPLPATSRSATRNPELERAMLALLNRDGRASATRIASELDQNPRHIRELLALMQRSGSLIQRTDLARSRSGWPVSAWHFMRVPATKLEGIAGRLENLPEVRLVSHTVGPHDVIMDVWLKDLGEVQRLEQALEIRLSGLAISDRSVVLRTVKQMGQILDDQGRSMGRSRL